MDFNQLIDNMLSNISDEVLPETLRFMDRCRLDEEEVVTGSIATLTAGLKIRLSSLLDYVSAMYLTQLEIEQFENMIDKFINRQFRIITDLMKESSIYYVGSLDDYYNERVKDSIRKLQTEVHYRIHILKKRSNQMANENSKTSSSVFNINGNNSRVNIHSTDNSNNTVNTTDIKVFNELREAIKTHVEDADKRESMLATVDEMEQTKGTSGFLERYKAFMSSASDHMTVLSPFLPMLTHWL